MLFSSGPFRPGYVTQAQADELNRLWGKVAALDGIAGVPPVQVYRGPNGQPVLSLTAGGGREGIVKGKLDGPMSPGGSATMSVWAAKEGLPQIDTGDNEVVWDWLLQTGQTIDAGTKVIAAWDHRSGRFYVVAAECETPA
jgi:hypothetical protein